MVGMAWYEMEVNRQLQNLVPSISRKGVPGQAVVASSQLICTCLWQFWLHMFHIISHYFNLLAIKYKILLIIIWYTIKPLMIILQKWMSIMGGRTSCFCAQDSFSSVCPLCYCCSSSFCGTKKWNSWSKFYSICISPFLSPQFCGVWRRFDPPYVRSLQFTCTGKFQCCVPVHVKAISWLTLAHGNWPAYSAQVLPVAIISILDLCGQ